MSKTIRTWAAVIAALAGAGTAQAHHSGSMYATTPLWIEGTVVRFEDVRPHTVTTLEDRSVDGQTRRWIVEGPPRVDAGMAVPQVGDVLEFCAFPYRPAAELSRMFPGVDFSARASREADASLPQSVAGHVMVTPDGVKQLWEPHGLLAECIGSSSEPRQSWLDFLNSNARARAGWCEQRRYAHIQSTAFLRDLVADVNSALADPCK